MQTVTVKDFETDEQLDQTVWRYLTFDKFTSLLERSAIWFSRVGALQDKFEGTLPVKPKGKLLCQHKEWEEQMPDGDFKDRLRDMSDRTINRGGEWTVVNCWYLGNVESSKMWEEYAADGRGVAIRSTIRRLSASLDIRGDYKKLTLLGRVNYVDFEEHDMDVNTAIDSAHRAFLKHKKFSFENEVRIVTVNVLRRGCLHPDGQPVLDSQLASPAIFDATRKGFYIMCSLSSLIDSIVLSPKSPPHFQDLYAGVFAQHGFNVPVVKSEISFGQLISTVKITRQAASS